MQIEDKCLDCPYCYVDDLFYEVMCGESECWRPIEVDGWEDKYEVSSRGNIRNKKTKKLRKLNVSNTGYLWVTLTRKEDKKRLTKWYHVHRLVAQAFIANPLGLPCVNHKDENKENNSIENLEWCDYKYNNSYGTRLNRIFSHGKRNNKSIPVAKYDCNGNIVKAYSSIAKAAEDGDNPSYSSIYKAIYGYNNRKTAGGYIWKKVEDNDNERI